MFLNYIIEPFNFLFFRYAALSMLSISLLCGILGSYVILKRLSSFAGSIAHSSFGGIGLALLYGFDPLLAAIGFGVSSSLLMEWIRIRFKQDEGMLINIVWVLGMSFGIVCIQLSPGFAFDLNSFFFGNLLLISKNEILFLSALAVGIVGINAITFRLLRAITFDEEYSYVLNIPVRLISLFLLGCVAITTVLLIRAMGMMLVIGLLILPAASAKNFCRSLVNIQILGSFIALFGGTLGLYLSYYLDQASGPMIIAVLGLIYVLSLIKKKRER